MPVHQLIPSFRAGDASAQAAQHLQVLLRRLGLAGGLYAGEVGDGLEALASPASALAPRPDALVLYHHGIASPLAGRLAHLPCRRGLVFHNITPARFYPGTHLEAALRAGRAQLAALAPSVELALGVSEYNCRELRAAGFANVHRVPLFVEPERFAAAAADPATLRRLQWHSGPTVLSVSRVMPHKRFEDLLALHAELLRVEPGARLLLVGGYDAGSAYFRGLQARAGALRNVVFLGRVGHAQLVAAYRSAHVFVSMSEHEGFGVPLLEAMAAGLPVLAYGAAAVPETLGGAGVVFDEKRFALLAELVRELVRDAPLREGVLAGQRRRLEELSADAARGALAHALASLSPPLRPPAPARRPRRRPRVGLVVQRFGEVTGGAEAYAQQVAERMREHWDITVLTSTAKDHLTWDNHFAPGPDRVKGLPVLRFPVVRRRNIVPFNRLSAQVFGRSLERVREEQWIAEQGPLMPGLLAHLEAEGAGYDGFVFFTYLYAPTVWGLPMVADRALLVPTTHDEPPLRFGLMRELFERPRALLCLTPEEAELVARAFPGHARARVVGTGVEVPRGQPRRFARAHGLDRPYLLYVGRLEPGKGVHELLQHHRTLRERFHDAPDLVLAGAQHMELSGPGVRYVGRIPDQEKHDALAGALAVVVPSRFESLSLLALEAFAHGTPVLVNGRSEVLVGQVRRSGAGATYTSFESFADGLRRVGEAREALGEAARAYARQLTWARVVAAYREEMDAIVAPERAAPPARAKARSTGARGRRGGRDT